MDFNKELEKYSGIIERRKAMKIAKEGILSNLISRQDALKKDIANSEKAIEILKSFNSTLESEIIKKFEGLISSGVKEIFGKEYDIKIEMIYAANSIGADFNVILPNKREVNIFNGEGGGIKDFISVLQRILYLVLEPTKPEKILFLDENLKHLDSERAIKALNFIKGLAKEFDIQIIMITHLNVLDKIVIDENDNIIEVYSDETGSKVKEHQ